MHFKNMIFRKIIVNWVVIKILYIQVESSSSVQNVQSSEMLQESNLGDMESKMKQLMEQKMGSLATGTNSLIYVQYAVQ